MKNVMAISLAQNQYKPKIVKSKKVYNRKAKIAVGRTES